jgi:hypothetical protein
MAMAERSITEILQAVVRPAGPPNLPKMIFQQDNAGPHSAHRTSVYTQ